jgi:hypothetical protein
VSFSFGLLNFQGPKIRREPLAEIDRQHGMPLESDTTSFQETIRTLRFWIKGKAERRQLFLFFNPCPVTHLN